MRVKVRTFLIASVVMAGLCTTVRAAAEPFNVYFFFEFPNGVTTADPDEQTASFDFVTPQLFDPTLSVSVFTGMCTGNGVAYPCVGELGPLGSDGLTLATSALPGPVNGGVFDAIGIGELLDNFTVGQTIFTEDYNAYYNAYLPAEQELDITDLGAPVAATPEPGTLTLMLTGATGALLWRRRQKSAGL